MERSGTDSSLSLNLFLGNNSAVFLIRTHTLFLINQAPQRFLLKKNQGL